MTDTITKPLVWVEAGRIGPSSPWYRADLPEGRQYTISDFGGANFHLSIDSLYLGTFPTLDAAKAAAQADYDTRARAMLSDETLAKLDEPMTPVKTTEAYIVWNAGRDEAVVFLDANDAFATTDGEPRSFSTSAIAMNFHEYYGEIDELFVETINIPSEMHLPDEASQ